ETTFDFSAWTHATDAEFTGNLTYNDQTHKFYTYYSAEIENEEWAVIGCSFDACYVPVVYGLPYEGAFVREPLSGFWQNVGYYTGIGGYDTYEGIVGNWKVNREGRLTGIKPIELVVPDIGIGIGGGGGLKKLNKLAQMIKKGQGPKSIIRLDKGLIYKELPHVHFDNGSALNINGVWKHGYKKLTNQEIKFLKQYEWILPDK
ncbi:MAG: hypothetical protein KH111_19575, partial [Bacteroidales bacterium]|nr:hypothetical protein [Bacteroidales bacterium]